MSHDRRASPRTVYAVLTGDIIASTGLAAEDLGHALELLNNAAGRLTALRPGAVYGAPEVFRGDAWQILLAEPGAALRLALLIKATLRSRVGADTRISVGIGRVEQIVADRISMSTGEAFTLSGRGLDKMTVYFDLTGALPERAGPMTRWLPAVMHLCSGLARRWTRRQAETVAEGLVLENPTQERIAKSLPRTVAKQTVQESLAGAGWRALIEAVWTFEQTDWSALAGQTPSRDGDTATHALSS